MQARHQSLLSQVPAEWDVRPLKQVAARIESGGTPSREVPSYWNGDVPWLTPGELTNLPGKYVVNTNDRITAQGVAASAATILPANSLLVTTRATLGHAALAGVPITTNQGFKSIVFGTDCHPDYYYHLFKLLGDELARRASGTTFLEVSGQQFGQIEVPVPPLHEQQRIAEVLDSADDSIGATRRVLVKLERSVSAYREARLASQAAAAATQDKEIGDVLLRAEYGVSSPLTYDEGTPVLRMNNLKGGEVDTSDLKYTVHAVPTNLKLSSGDVLFNRTNSMDHVGRVGIWRGPSGSFTFASYLVRLVPDVSMVLPDFLNLWLNREQVQAEMRRYATPGVHQVNINPTNLRMVGIRLPQLNAQRALCNELAIRRTEIAKHRDILTKFQRIRLGLWADLLTGRARVPDAEQAVEAVM
jgi:type I restriction enzyme S subunit